MTHAVVALGGNAILMAGEKATFSIQMGHLEDTARTLVSLLGQYDNLLVTHGNGPQVGDILLQNELASADMPPMPLDACVAESQGLIAYMLQLAVLNELERSGMKADVICCLTLVEVEEEEMAASSSKPIGPYYHKEEAERLEGEKGWTFMIDKVRGGHRRAVPSPAPSKIVGLEPIQILLESKRNRPLMIVAGGGGGVPIKRSGNGYAGVEAVIDKDLTTSLLACSTGADTLIMLTDIGAVYIDYGKPTERPIRETTPEELESLLEQGQFPPGTMGPKVRAAVDFVRGCGNRAVITNAASLQGALLGENGTNVVKERRKIK